MVQIMLPLTLPQPTTALAVLAVLPPNIRWLELAVSPCAGPLLQVLARFSRLEQLTITGNGADIQWDAGHSAVLAPLLELHLDYRRDCEPDMYGYGTDAVIGEMPASVALALPAATALHTLHLRLVWSDKVATLCHALPTLRQLE